MYTWCVEFGKQASDAHLFSFPFWMTAWRSVAFLSLHTYVFLLVMPPDAAVLWGGQTHDEHFGDGVVKRRVPITPQFHRPQFEILSCDAAGVSRGERGRGWTDGGREKQTRRGRIRESERERKRESDRESRVA